MEFRQLKAEDKKLIRDTYKSCESRTEAQEKLSQAYGVTTRAIRKWAKQLGITGEIQTNKILIYDIETSQVPAMVWWTGKQYVGYSQLLDEPKIISIAYKWLGSEDIKTLSWDSNHSDKRMIQTFLKDYNKAIMVIGQNNDRFDNRWINARAMKYGLDVNTLVRSFDIMKETKRLFRLPSYSMAYITKYLGIETKLEHEGIKMWQMIQSGTKEEQDEYIQKMLDYNRQDIVATEDMYLTLRKYMGHKMHFGVLNDEFKWTCPNCGTTDVKFEQLTVTPSGTIQRIMRCNKDNVQYKINNKTYIGYLNRDKDS